jgi:putative ABC transport system ATP-binding protein
MITLENITKTYHMGTTEVHALRGISLHIERGEFVVVLGPSGSGKSTLLNIISALDVPSSGKIVVNGHDISRTTRNQRFDFRRETISFIFQSFNLFPGLTALENVQFMVDMQSGKNGHGQAKKVLEQVSLGKRVDHFTHELSGGEQQRVAIARALATGNPVLLADEPTGSLDFQTGVEIIQLLQAQAAAGKTVVLVTHNREISRVADRVIEISSGEIVSDGKPAKLPISELHW